MLRRLSGSGGAGRQQQQQQRANAAGGEVPPAERAGPVLARGVAAMELARKFVGEMDPKELEVVVESVAAVTSKVAGLLVALAEKTADRDEARKAAFGTFASHFKIQAGTEASALRDVARAAQVKLDVFVDSDELTNLELIPWEVARSRSVVSLLAPHSAAEDATKDKYGVFSRPYCVVEMVAAFQMKKPVVGVEVVKRGGDFRGNAIPQTRDEIVSLLSPKEWETVGRITNLKRVPDDAVAAVEWFAKQCHAAKLAWEPANPRDAPKQVAEILVKAGVVTAEEAKRGLLSAGGGSFAVGRGGAKNGHAPNVMVVRCAADASTEAQALVERTAREFPDEPAWVVAEDELGEETTPYVVASVSYTHLRAHET